MCGKRIRGLWENAMEADCEAFWGFTVDGVYHQRHDQCLI
jgi:hypothetical protein